MHIKVKPIQKILKTVHIFVSSIFRDMHAERDCLIKVVFLELRKAERIKHIQNIATTFGIPIKDRKPEEVEEHPTRELGYNGHSFLWMVDNIPSDIDVDSLHQLLAPQPSEKTPITTLTMNYDCFDCIVPLRFL